MKKNVKNIYYGIYALKFHYALITLLDEAYISGKYSRFQINVQNMYNSPLNIYII